MCSWLRVWVCRRKTCFITIFPMLCYSNSHSRCQSEACSLPVEPGELQRRGGGHHMPKITLQPISSHSYPIVEDISISLRKAVVQNIIQKCNLAIQIRSLSDTLFWKKSLRYCSNGALLETVNWNRLREQINPRHSSEIKWMFESLYWKGSSI